MQMYTSVCIYIVVLIKYTLDAAVLICISNKKERVESRISWSIAPELKQPFFLFYLFIYYY